MAEPHRSLGSDSPSAVLEKLVRSDADVAGALVAFHAASGASRAHVRAALAALDAKAAGAVLAALEKAISGVARERAVVTELYAATIPAAAPKARGDAEKVLAGLVGDASARIRAIAATVAPAARAKALLDDASANVRAAAATRLIALGDVLPDEQHVALVASAHIRTRVVGLEAPLSASADLDVQFRKAATDPNRSLRRRALKALAGTAAGKTLVLSAATGDKCPIIRRESAAALDVDTATQRSTLAHILDREADAETRLAALTAVMRLPKEDREPLLAKALLDLDGAVRERADGLSREGQAGPDALKADLLVRSESWEAAVALGDAALPALYAAAERPGTSRRETDARLAALAALARLRAADMGRLGPLVSDADGRVRAAAIDAIEAAGTTAVGARNVDALIAATLDREARVRAVAIRAVGNLGRGASAARVSSGVSAASALLTDPEPSVRAAAIKALAALDAVDVLATVARDPDADTRVAALEQLASFKDAVDTLRLSAISAVVVALGDELPVVRLAAERTVKILGWAPVGLPDLGDRGYERWLTPADFSGATPGKNAKASAGNLLETVLLPALDHADARFRRAAVEALGRERVASSLVPIRARLDDPNALVRLAAAEATVALGDPPGTGEAFAAWHVRREAFAAAAALGAAAVGPLSAALSKHPVGAFRRAAAVALSQTGTSAAAPALEGALSDPEPAVVVAAADALLALKLQEPPLGALCRCLDSSADIVRLAGERALAGYHQAGLQSAVIAALDLALSPTGLDAPGRGLAALLLGRLLDAPSSKTPKTPGSGWRALLAALHDPVSSVRAAAATALGPSAPLSRLMELLGESDPGVVRAARGALAALTPSPEIAAAIATADRLAHHRWSTLADSAAPAGALAVLLGALSEASREPDVNTRRAHAAAALGHFKTPEARTGLEGVLGDPIPTVRIAAARSLGQHADPGSLVPLAATLAIPDVPFLVAVMSAVADIAVPAVAAGAKLGAASPTLIAGLDYSAPDVRVAAAQACGRIDHPDLAAPLIARLGDTSADVSDAAETALSALLHHASTPATLENALPAATIPMRRAIARLLAAGAPERLKGSLSDADPGVRRIAAEGLGRLTGKAAASVISLLLPKRFDPDPDCRAAVFKSLGLLGAPRTALIGALADPATNVRLTFEDRSNPVPIGVLDSVRAGSGVSALRSAPAELLTDLQALLLHAAMTGRMGAPARADLCRALAGAEVPGLVQALLHLAETSEVAVAVGAIDGLAHPTAADAFDRVAWLAEQGSGDTRAAAIGALAAIDGKRGASVILRHDAAGDFRVRAAVATALGSLPEIAAEPHSSALFGLLADASPDVRSAAAHALGRLAAAHEARPAAARAFVTAAAPLLVTAAFDADSAVRAAATRSLTSAARIAPAALAAIVTGDLDAARRRVAIGYSVDAKAIATALADPDSGVRTGAATQAAQVPATPELLTALARRMGDDDADVRAAALRAISAELIRRDVTSVNQLPDGLDPDPVLGALADPESAVRAAARDALDRLGLDPDPASRLAADALAARGDPTLALGLGAASFADAAPPKGKGRAVRPGGVAVLLTFVRVHRGLPESKVAAVARIATVPRPDAARALADALTTAYPEVINAAARALRTHPEAAVVQDALEARVIAGPAPRRAIALEALAAAVPTRAVPFAETLISHGEPALRIASCRAFGEAVQRGALKSSRCQAQLVTALADVVPGVRAAAAKALGLAPAGVVPALNADATSALLDRTNDADASVRDAAAETLAAAAEGIRDALAARLTVSDATARRTIVGALRNDAPSAKVLLPYVDDGDAAVRHAAIWALSSLAVHADSSAAPEDVATRVADHLVDTDSDVRAMAAQALGQIGASEKVSPGARSGYVVRLAGLLADRDARPRIAAAASLRRLGADGATIQGLTALAADVREHRWARLGEVLSHGGVALIAHALETDTVGGRRFREQLAMTLQGRAEPFVVQALIRSLKDTDPLLRSAAARALGHPAAIAAVPTLVVATRETRAEVRAAAVEALCKADPTQTGPLFAALSDPFEPVRLAAATALGDVIPTPALAAALEGALKPSDPTLLHAAARSLARLALNADAAGKAGAKAAGAALAHAFESPDVAIRVAAAAGAVGHIAALVKALADSAPDVRCAAAQSLVQSAHEPAARAALAAAARHDASAPVRRAAVDALRAVTPREGDVQDALVATLADRDPAVLEAARAAFTGQELASVPDVLAARRADRLVDDVGSAVPALLVAVADGRFGPDDGPRRASAAMALGLCVARGVDSARIVPALVAQLDTDDAVVRAGAARGLGAAGDASVIPALAQRLNTAEPGPERRAFAEALGALGAGDALAGAATDPDPVVRRVAAATCRDHTTLLLLIGDRELDVARTAGARFAAVGGQDRLAALLDDAKVNARLGAVSGLEVAARAGDHAAESTLHRAGLDSVAAVRAAALRSAAAVRTVMKSGKAAHDLADLVVTLLGRDPDDGVRLAAATVAVDLAQLDRATAKRLEAALDLAVVDASADVVRAARAGLDTLGRKLLPLTEQVLELAAVERFEAIGQLGPAVVPYLERILSERWTDRLAVTRRVGAAKAAGQLGAPGRPALELAASDPAERVRQAAARAARGLPDGDAFAVLDRLAADVAVGVREEVCRSLGELGGSASVERLVALRLDGDEHVRLAAAVALAGPKTAAVAKVAELLLERDSALKIKGANLLAELGHPGGIEPLIVALGDADARVRLHVRAALGVLGWTPVGHRTSADAKGYAFWTSRAEWLAGLPGGQGEHQGLIAALSSPDGERRRDAAEGLEALGDAAAIPALAGVLTDPDADVRLSAATAIATLIRIGRAGAASSLSPDAKARIAILTGQMEDAAGLGEGAVPALIEVLATGSVNAARVLATIGPAARSARAALEGALTAADPALREAAATALGRLADKAASAALEAALSDAVPVVAAAAGRALAALGADKLLEKALGNASSRYGAAVGIECAPAGDRPANAIAKALRANSDSDTRVALIAAATGVPGAFDAICERLSGDDDAIVRAAAASALAHTGAPAEAAKALFDALSDASPTVRTAATASLAHLGTPGDPTALAIALAVARNDWTSAVRAGPAAIPLLTRVTLERTLDKDAVLRRAGAVKALESLGAFDAITAAASDRASPVRAAVLAAFPAALQASKITREIWIPVIRAGLADVDARTRRHAASAAGLIGDTESIPTLSELAANDRDGGVRDAAAIALAKPAMRSIDALVRTLEKGDATDRAAAAGALGEAGLGAAVDPLVKALGDPSAVVRSQARGALEKLGFVPVGVPDSAELRGTTRIARFLDFSALSARVGAPAAPPDGAAAMVVASESRLLNLIGVGSAIERLGALLALNDLLSHPARVGDKEAASNAVAARLEDAVIAVRRAAALWLRDAGLLQGDLSPTAQAAALVELNQDAAAAELGADAVPALVRALRDAPEPERRAAACAGLGRLELDAADPARAVAALALTEGLSDEHVDVRIAAATAFGALGVFDAALESALGDPSDTVRTAVAEALAGLSDAGRSALERALEAGDPATREAGCEGLERLGSEADTLEDRLAALLATDTDDAVRIAAARALAHVGTDALPRLAAALEQDTHPAVRAQAARSLALRGDEAAVPSLEAALADDDVTVRAGATAALESFGWIPAGPVARALLALSRNDFDDVIVEAPEETALSLLGRVLAARGTDLDTAERKCRVLDAVVRSQRPGLAPLATRALGDRAARVRRAALPLVVALGLTDTLDALAQLAEHDTSDAVRTAACGAIGALALRLAAGGVNDALSGCVRALERIARQDLDANVRLAAATALAQPGLLSLSLLIEQLSAADADVRATAARTLGITMRREAVGPLITALSDIAKPVQTASRDALTALGWAPVGLPTSTTREGAGYARWLSDTDLVPAGLPETGPFAAAQAAGLLAALGRSDAAWRLAALDGLDALVRNGLLALDRRAQSDIAGRLADPLPLVRRAAARLLAPLPGDTTTRGRSMAILGQYDGAAAAGAIDALLLELDGPLAPTDRPRLIAALATAKASSTLRETIGERLAAQLTDSDALVRAAAVTALGRLGQRPDALEGALGDDSDVVRNAAAVAVAGLGALGREIIARALLSSRAELREAACDGVRALAEGAADFEAEVCTALTDDDVGVRLAAARALAVIPSDVLKALSAALDSDSAPVVRAEAARALAAQALRVGKKGTSFALGTLEAALADDDVLVRDAAHAGLGQLGWTAQGRTSRALLALAGNDFAAVLDAGFGPGDDAPTAASAQMAAGLLGRVLTARGTDADTADRKCRVLDTLARSGDPRHGSLVASAMTDRVAKVRRAAVAASVVLSYRDAPDVLGTLAEHDVSDAVRSAACGAIGALGLASLVKTLERVARLDRDARVRLAASTALASPGLLSLDLLIDQLSSPDADVRTDAATALGATGRREAVGPLTTALSDIAKSVQTAARAALSALGWVPVGLPTSTDVSDTRSLSRWLTDLEVVPDGLPAEAPFSGVEANALIGLLGHRDPRWRLAAADGLEGLVTSGLLVLDAEGAAALSRALDDDERAVRIAAATILARTKATPSAVRGAVLAALGDYAGAAGVGALKALLHELGSPLPSALREALLGALATLSAEHDGVLAPVLARELDAADAGVRAAAAAAFETRRLHDPALAAHLGDPAEVVRQALAHALAATGEAGLTDLEAALTSADPATREAACTGLARLGVDANRLTSALITTLADTDDGVRVAAVRALAHVGDDEVLPALLGALDADTSPMVRAEAARSLGLRGAADAMNALESALADDDVLVRAAATASLHALGWEPRGRTSRALLALSENDFAGVIAAGFDDGEAEPTPDAPTPDTEAVAAGLLRRVLTARGTDADTADRKVRVLETLARSGRSGLATLSIEALVDRVARVRRAAVVTTVALGVAAGSSEVTRAPVAAAALAQLAEHDSNEAVRAAACGAIGALGLAGCVKTLERIARSDRDPNVRLAAATALASPSLRSLDLLIDQLAQGTPDARTAAATALGATGRPEAVGPLTAALADIHKPVQVAAREALFGLGWVPVGLASTLDGRGFGRWLGDRDILPDGLPEQGPFGDAEAHGLLALASHESPTWRLAAMVGLADLVRAHLTTLALDIGDTLNTLLGVLGDPVRAVRRAAAHLLALAATPGDVSPWRGQALAIVGRYAEAAELGARDALLHELSEPLPASERADLLLALASLPGEVDDGIIVSLVGELDATDAVVRMAAASALERVFARVPSEAEIAPQPDAPAGEPEPAAAAAEPEPASALEAPPPADVAPADEPPPEPKKKKKK